MKRFVVPTRLSDVREAAGIACLVALGAVTVGACADSERADDQAIRTDSAGVSMVHYPSLPSLEESRFVLSPEPDLIIGREGAEPAYEFFRIAGVARLSDGSLVVANAGTHELRFFDADAQFLGSTGGRGEGPGEFRGIRGLWVTQGDSLIVWDEGGRTLNLFSPGGEYVRSARVGTTPFNDYLQQPRLLGILGDGRVATFLASINVMMPSGPQRYPQLLAFTALDDEQWDSIRVTRSAEVSIEPHSTNPASTVMINTTFSASSIASAASSTVALVDTEDFRIELYNTYGQLSKIISVALPDIPVTTGMLDPHIDSLIEQFFPNMSDQDRGPFRERIRSQPLASVLPKIRAVIVDSADRIWVERYDEPGSHASRWEVFERDGTWIGRIEMPYGFVRFSGGAPALVADEEQVTGVWVDPETGIETVRVHRIRQHAP